MKLEKNLNKTGRLIRFGFALVLFMASIYYKNLTLLFAAAFVLIEALFSWCIVYQLLGINKCKLK